MPEGGVHVLLPVIIDIGIVIVEHVREVDVAQRASFDGIVQPAISPFADTPCQGDLGVITCLMVVGDVKQGGDNILTVETDAHVDGAVGLVLHLEDQVPVLVADQFVVDVPVGVGSDQDRDGVLELLHGQVAVLFQATDLQQPGLVLGVGALEMDMPDMKRIGRESGRLPSDRYFVVRDTDPGFQGDDLVPLPPGRLFAPLDERVECRSREAGRVVGIQSGADQEIGLPFVLLIFLVAIEGDDLADHVAGAIDVVLCFQVAGAQVDTDDDVRFSHGLGDIGGIVIVQSAIHEDHAVLFHGRENGGNGHAGPERQGKAAAAEDMLLAPDDIDGDTGEGDGQLVEIERIVVADGQPREQVLQVLSLDHAADGPLFLAFPEGERDDITLGVLFLGEGEVAAFHPVAQQQVPVLQLYQRVDLVGRVAHGIKSADDGAHAGPGDIVDWDASLLKNLKHADVRRAFRSAAAQHEADPFPFSGARGQHEKDNQ